MGELESREINDCVMYCVPSGCGCSPICSYRGDSVFVCSLFGAVPIYCGSKYFVLHCGSLYHFLPFCHLTKGRRNFILHLYAHLFYQTINTCTI